MKLLLLTMLSIAVLTIKHANAFRFASSQGRTFSAAPRRVIQMVSTERPDTDSTTSSSLSAIEQLGNAGIAGAAVVAASAVNQAVSMRKLTAPSTAKSFVVTDNAGDERVGKVDEYGLPLVYNKDAIEQYWASQSGALTSRWTEFLSVSVPFLTRVLTIVISKGSGALSQEGADLARDARERMEKLGATYIKLGQMMSVRPDVLPEAALEELKILQDSVQPFDTETAVQQIENELGGPLSQFFSEISKEPVAAASLAQVYRATMLDGRVVAVKVQRPRCLETVSKDLYVLRRAAEVYQGLMERFAPQQKTDYVALLNEWAIGFYTELDFLNEAANQKLLKAEMLKEGVSGVYVPYVVDELTTRRILVSEWMEGRKLSECTREQIKDVTPDAQEAFLSQLLKIGCMHADPHPGNLMYLDTPRQAGTSSSEKEAKIALLDFGLVARITKEDQDKMVSAIIHLANRDYPSLVTDFERLDILGKGVDASIVVPLMDKALTPYVRGGGAQRYKERVMETYGMDGSLGSGAGGFAAMTSDAISVLNDIPFSIPPYFALLGRAIVTLEGVALTGNPNYGLIMESYPFVARKLLSEDRPELQKALQEVLYAGSSSSGGAESGKEQQGMSATRLSVLLNSALDVVKKDNSNAFIDFDSLPDESISTQQALKFLCGPKSGNLRDVLVNEAVTVIDMMMRQAVRKGYGQIVSRVPRLPFGLGGFLPSPENVMLPMLIPTPEAFATSTDLGFSGPPDLSKINPAFVTPANLLETAAPKLSMQEELYALSLVDLARDTAGDDVAAVVNGDSLTEPAAAVRVLTQFVNGGSITSTLFPGIPISDNIRSALGRVASVTGTGTGTGTDDSKTGDAAVFAGVSEGIDALDAEERVVFDSFVGQVTGRLRERIVTRLQVLV
jgi:predicted unusual protein kinase regulating ubiquinone biosynthesis (AarF/ABC1/UbiB family)